MSLPATERTVGGILVSVARFVNLLGLGAGSGGAVLAGGWVIGSIGSRQSSSYCNVTARML